MKKYKLTLSLLLILLSILLIFIEFKMRSANQPFSEKADAIIILGAKVNVDGPSLSLISRMDSAVLAAKYNLNAKLVLSGGQGSDEPISEAQVMHNYLILQGIDKNR